MDAAMPDELEAPVNNLADLRVAGRIARCVMLYVHEALGEAAVEEIRRESGIGAEALGPSFDTEWVTGIQLEIIADTAARICGESEIGRRAGEVSFRLLDELYPMLLSTGSVADAVELAVGLSDRSRTTQGHRVERTDDQSIVVRCRAALPTRFGCTMSAGFWAGIPTLFGARGYVTEPSCQARGDEVCEYHVRWSEALLADADAMERNRRDAESQIARFELMHTVAAELAQQESVDALLRQIAARAGSVVTAPSAVVLVRLAEGDDPSIGYHGLTETEADEVIRAFELGLYAGDPSAIVVEVCSARRSYGHMVVFNQPDTVFADVDARMVGAFAGFATAAIETAAALEAARIERDRAESLLGLAKVLAEVGSTEEMVQRIAEAVPTILRCARSAVSLWHPEVRVLETIGAWPRPEGPLLAHRVPVDGMPNARRVVEGLVPMLLEREHAVGDEAALLDRLDARVLAVAPIVVRGELLGTVTAHLSDGGAPGDVDETLHRLSGLADHAGAALDNSRLLDEVRHRALHDSLTGLPNRSLAEDRVRHALSIAERSDRWVTLLFVDLDEFKAVNDRLGHAAGDELLREASGRLRRCVRASDTVCRLGGDEFLVLLENTTGDTDGSRVAQQIIEALREPFLIAGEVARVSASIGITSAPGRGTSHDELLARADEAMYEVKRRGRDGWAVYGS
jgi:diguanylate cyclase (GGDEF)-like protein